MKNGIKTLAMWLIIGIIFIVVLSSIVENSDSKLKYSDLIADINSGKVESIQVESDGKKATVQLKDEKIRKTFIPWFGFQLENGNSLIGARREVYDVSSLVATKKEPE